MIFILFLNTSNRRFFLIRPIKTDVLRICKTPEYFIISISYYKYVRKSEFKLISYQYSFAFIFLYYVFLVDPVDLVILFDMTMLEKNHGTAKAAVLKIIDKLSENNNIVIHNYILIPFDQGF